MKIGPKLALAFALMAVMPLGLASVVFIASTQFVATNISDRAQDVFATRITDGLTRATRLGASQIEETRARLSADVETAADEIALSLDALAPETGFSVDEILQRALQGDGQSASENGIAGVRIETDVNRDDVAETLTKLQGLEDVGRVTFVRNQSLLTSMSLALESGLTIWFPGTSAIEPNDLRESDWYLSALETIQTGWHGVPEADSAGLNLVTPVQRADGTLLGVFRFVVSLQRLLDTTMPAATLPSGTTAHLIVIPNDHPNLFPHRMARRDFGDPAWTTFTNWEPLTPVGDEAWLKILSDMRSGVGGLISADRDGDQEVWSFQPIGSIAQGPMYLAFAVPQSALDSARATAEKSVAQVFRTQLRDALMFAMAAGFAALGLGFIIARSMTTPIQDLHAAATKLGEGDFDVRVTPKGRDEIAELAAGFNEMVPALADQVRVAKDLKIAREIQQHLIPSQTPKLSGFDIAGRAKYCDETGGDYLDFVPMDDGARLGCAIGDVTGHGISAALMMASARSALRAHARQGLTPIDLISALNADVVADASGGRFLTLLYIDILADEKSLSLLSCGHEPPLLFNAATDAFSIIEGEGIPLGVDGSWSYELKTVELSEDAMLIGYTDGVREAKNTDGERYGLERLKATIVAAKQRGADSIATAILEDVATFRGDQTQNDDETVLVIKPL